MKFGGRKIKVKGNSALAIAAGVAVAFMFIATIVSVVIYKNRMEQASELLPTTAGTGAYDAQPEVGTRTGGTQCGV